MLGVASVIVAPLFLLMAFGCPKFTLPVYTYWLSSPVGLCHFEY
jgi:hypothetical protein